MERGYIQKNATSPEESGIQTKLFTMHLKL